MNTYAGYNPIDRKPYRRPRKRLIREVNMKPIDRSKLAKRRKAEGYTQRQLAALCSCSQAAISGLEAGNMLRCSEDLAKQIAKWLRRDVDELFDREENTRVSRMTNATGSKHHAVPVAA